ncbi:type VI secretion system contractile sheath domain-containing protein [Ruegeria sp. ANG-S4]|uniref:type VI secretion system contractile sheath domain-containing protein n=1 Tax=Ruegeria sp. ANG-S4 TaxID=1577904 RepID=UPI00315A42FC
MDDALASLPETGPDEQDDGTDDILSGLSDAAPDDESEDSAVADALSSLPEIEEAEADTQSDDVLSGLAELEPEDTVEAQSVEDALSSIPDVPETDEDDSSDEVLSDLADTAPHDEANADSDLDDLLGDLANKAPDEAEEEDATADVLAALPDVEEAEDDDSSEDILDDLAASAPDAEPEADDELDDLLSDLADLAPDEADEEDAADEILASVPDLEDSAEEDNADDVLGDLADTAPAEDVDEGDDLDELLGDLADASPETEEEDDSTDDVLAAMPEVESDEDDDALDDILGDLTETGDDEAADDDLDALLGDLTEDTPEEDAEDSSDLDDLLGDLSDAEPEDAEDTTDPLADLDLDDQNEGGDDVDLDDLLGDLDLDDDDTETEDLGASPSDVEETDPALDDLDLDGLLDDLGPDDEDSADPSDADDLDLDLDDLLADDDDESASEDTPAPEGATPSGEPALAFGRMSADRPDPERLKRTRFRIAIFGDFSGRSARGQIETGDALAARKPILLDPDTVEEVIESFATTLVLPLGKDGAGIEVKLNELDDLHPDELYEKVELFDGLSGLKGQLSSGATADNAAKQLIAWGEEFGQAVVPPRRTSSGNTVRADLKLSDFQKLIGDTSGELAQASPVDDLLKRVVGPHIRKLPSPDVSAMQTAVDEALSAAMRMVLHHPEFQSVEAQWRSLDLIARSVEDDDTLDVILYDVSAEEIAADLAAEEDLAKTGLVRLLTEEPLDEENGRGGYSALIGLYTFEETPPHAEILGRIGRVAAHVDAPFISAITPAYLDIKKEDRNPLVAKAWDTFRAMPEAGHVGLASPRFLLRRPYGAKSEPIYEFDFEEFTETEGLRGMLWANPAVLVTILLARSFKQNGKAMNLGSVMSLGGIPFHYVNDRYGDQVALPCTERNITMEKHEHSVQRGYMPVLSVKGRDEIRLGSFNSVAGKEILGPWSGVPVPEPSPDVPPEPEDEDVLADDDLDLDADLDLDIDLGDDDSTDLDTDDFDLDLGDDDSSSLDDFLAGFGDDDDDDEDEEEMDPELAALLADL